MLLCFCKLFVSKTETWRTTPFANNAVEQLCMISFDKIQGRQGLQNLSVYKYVVILSLYFCDLLFEKPYVSGLITKEPYYMIAHGNPWIMKSSKFFLV